MPGQSPSVRSPDVRVEKVYKCACHGEGMTITYWPEDKDFTFMILRSGGKTLLTWKEALKVIWSIIRRSRVEWDDLIMNRDTARAMAREILRISK